MDQGGQRRPAGEECRSEGMTIGSLRAPRFGAVASAADGRARPGPRPGAGRWRAGRALALNPKDRAVVGEAFAAADGGDWPRAFRLVEEVADPLPALTLRWLRMIEAPRAGRLRHDRRFPAQPSRLAVAGGAPDRRRGHDHRPRRSRADPALLPGPGAADHARHDPLRRGAVPDRPGRAGRRR